MLQREVNLRRAPFPDNDPAQPVVIKSMTVVGDPPRPTAPAKH